MKNKKQSTKKCKTKLRERERNNLLCVGKQCIEWERELENYNKKMRIRRAKNKGKKKDIGKVLLSQLVAGRLKGKREGERIEKV